MIETNLIIAGCIGFIAAIFLVALFKLIFLRKKKHDLKVIKQLVYDAGIDISEGYKKIKELEGIIKELENASG